MLISIICPFYNEEQAVAAFFHGVNAVISKLSEYEFELICINDGSKDKTLEFLLLEQTKDPRIKIIDFSRNFGKEAALTAGIDMAQGDAVIPIDADLQDPPELIIKMLEKWREGYEVVLGRRADRSSDSFLKRTTAKLFYRLEKSIADCDIPSNVGDFRLMDRKVVAAIKKLPERRRFMKGIFAWVGFKTAILDYTRHARDRGTTKFSPWKLWNFAIEGITSFSTMPLRVWIYIGTVISILSILYAIYMVLRVLIFGIDVPGYASIFTSILFLGGVQLISIGIIGEYIGRIYYETKQRPLYIVRDVYPNNAN